jgi:hypothetical protein
MSNPPPEGTQQAAPFAGFSRLVRILGQFVAPTTLVTALLFYFGWAHVYWFFDYFGVDSSVLGASTTDYVMRAVDALFIPLIVIAVVGLALMWGYIALPQRVRRGPTAHWQLTSLTVIAILLLANGLTALYDGTRWVLNSGLCVAPICVIVGVVLLWYLILLRRNRIGQTSRSDAAILCEWAVMFILVAMSLFWIATDYSVAVGQTRARQQAELIPYRPEAILFSEKDLHLDDADVHKTVCTTAPGLQSAYNFRYDGLVLMIEMGSHYVLVPSNWKRGDGTAVVLPKDGIGATRLEFATAHNYRPPPTC